MKAVTIIGKPGRERNILAATSDCTPEDSIARDADLGIMHAPKLSHVLTGEMSRLHNAGFWLLPLGLNRKPLVRLTKRDGSPVGRLPLSEVISKMAAAGSSNFGIRLPGMIVVDIDTDTREAHEYVERRFGASTVQVKSPKGVHHYYKFKGQRPKNVKLPGIVIDFKLGMQEHVAGPYAERQDGGMYLPLLGRLQGISGLPDFVDREPDNRPKKSQVDRLSSSVPVGARNSHMCSIAIRYVSDADTKEELLGNLIAYRNIHCDDPTSIPDRELHDIADWAIQKKGEGRIYQGRRSGVIIPRESIDRLAALGEGTALLLYSVIQADLGHKPDYEFSIVPDALRQSGKLKVGRRQIYDAIQVLIDERLIEMTFQSEKPKVPHRYRLVQGEAGERFNNYIGTPIGHKGFRVLDGGKSDASA